jgi:hypothetical protein
MPTVADAVKQAREILLDTDAVSGYRYSDEDLLVYVWDAVQQAYSLRPDIFIGQYTTPLPASYQLTDAFPLPNKLFAATSTYMAGRCELRDSEFSLDGRAMTFIAALTAALLKGT